MTSRRFALTPRNDGSLLKTRLPVHNPFPNHSLFCRRHKLLKHTDLVICVCFGAGANQRFTENQWPPVTREIVAAAAAIDLHQSGAGLLWHRVRPEKPLVFVFDDLVTLAGARLKAFAAEQRDDAPPRLN
jgi:hypothetical protein